MMRKLPLVTLLFLSPLFFMQISHAEVYKWIDENGKTVYGDKPNSEAAHKVKIKIKQTPEKNSAANQRLKQQQKLLGVMQEERHAKFLLKEEMKKQDAAQQEKCTELIKKLQEVKIATHLYEDTGDPNNPRIYTEEERKVGEGKLAAYIKENCQSG